MRYSILLLLLSSISALLANTIPPERLVDWTIAGVRDSSTRQLVVVNMQNEGLIGDGSTPNDATLTNIINSHPQGAILQFSNGEFLFTKTIKLPSNFVIRGTGAANTIFRMNLGGSGQAISVSAPTTSNQSIALSNAALVGEDNIYANTVTGLAVGDWIEIKLNDTHLITSDWALNSVGQIASIKAINGNKIILNSSLRISFELAYSPYLTKISTVSNVGIECLKILRIDDTSPQHTSNIYYSHAVNCWVKAIESENCSYSHIQAVTSSNIAITGSYFKESFGYGEDGNGYGVMLHYTTNECRIDNNIFNHLRHSMIVQAGANGNIFAYNYSINPFWETYPNDATGDMVLHGNFPFANLFEQNICQNIVIDDSHGPNGKYNTIFRNRAERFGIFFSATNSPSQTMVGNEITNNTFPYSMVNYTIQGTDQFLWGNNVRGTLLPAQTATLIEKSYGYTQKPDFVPTHQWGAIGTPNTVNSNSNPAKDRYASGNLFCNCCNDKSLNIEEKRVSDNQIVLFPNPTSNHIYIQYKGDILKVSVLNQVGENVSINSNSIASKQIECTNWQPGIYQIIITLNTGKTVAKKVIID